MGLEKIPVQRQHQRPICFWRIILLVKAHCFLNLKMVGIESILLIKMVFELQEVLLLSGCCLHGFTLHEQIQNTVGPRLGWPSPEKDPDNRKKIPVLDYWDSGIARIY